MLEKWKGLPTKPRYQPCLHRSTFFGGNTKRIRFRHIKLSPTYGFQGSYTKSTEVEIRLKRQRPPCLSLLLSSGKTYRSIRCRNHETAEQLLLSGCVNSSSTLHHIYLTIHSYKSRFASSIKGLPFCYTTLCCRVINTWTLCHVNNETSAGQWPYCSFSDWRIHSDDAAFNCSLLFLHGALASGMSPKSEWRRVKDDWL